MLPIGVYIKQESSQSSSITQSPVVKQIHMGRGRGEICTYYAGNVSCR